MFPAALGRERTPVELWEALAEDLVWLLSAPDVRKLSQLAGVAGRYPGEADCGARGEVAEVAEPADSRRDLLKAFVAEPKGSLLGDLRPDAPILRR